MKRALAALVLGLSLFLGNVGFNISHLFFVRDLSDDDGAQYAMGDDLKPENLLYTAFHDGSGAGSATAAALHARYVIAVAEERSVRNSLMRLINATGSETVPETNSVRTIAAAKRKVLNCGDFSNLVMCNPWENTTSQNFETIASDPSYSGLQFSSTANGTMAYRFNLARRLHLEGSAAVKQICNDTPPGYDPSNSTARAQAVRVICMLAAAKADRFCEAEELKFVPAEAEYIATSLNTAFDMWDEPIASVLDWADATHPLHDMSPLFQPDINVLKGKVWHEPRAIANAELGIPASSRLNYVEVDGYDGLNNKMPACLRNVANGASIGNNSRDDCYRDGDGNELTYIGNPSSSDIGNNSRFLEEYYSTIYSNRMSYENRNKAQDVDTFYDLYLKERGTDPASEPWMHADVDFVSPFPAFLSSIMKGESAVSLYYPETSGPGPKFKQDVVREDGSLSKWVWDRDGNRIPQVQVRPDYDDITGEPLDDDEDGNQNLTSASPNYTYVDPATDDIDRSIQRRVFDVTLINCGEASVNDAGENVAPIAGYAKMLLMSPPEVTCPDGGEACLNSELSSVRVITEFVGKSDYASESYAVLVR